MTVKTYWALSVEDSAKHKPAAEAQNKASIDAKNYIVERINCDGVFITTSNSVYLGFKQRQDNPMLHKMPDYYDNGQYLYRTKDKTEWGKIVIEAENIASSAVKFDKYCKELWPKMVVSLIGSDGVSSSVFSETSFVFLSNRVIAMVPFSDNNINLSIISDGFQELTGNLFEVSIAIAKGR